MYAIVVKINMNIIKLEEYLFLINELSFPSDDIRVIIEAVKNIAINDFLSWLFNYILSEFVKMGK